MGKVHQVIQAKDEIAPVELPVALIDQMLSELSVLYLERFKAMRAGDQAALQALTDKITDIKTLLGQI